MVILDSKSFESQLVTAKGVIEQQSKEVFVNPITSDKYTKSSRISADELVWF
jgi:hypothetical protein